MVTEFDGPSSDLIVVQGHKIYLIPCALNFSPRSCIDDGESQQGAKPSSAPKDSQCGEGLDFVVPIPCVIPLCLINSGFVILEYDCVI